MIAIKDMEMPSSCHGCPFVKNERTNDYGSYGECGILEDYETINLLEHSKYPNCPLVEQESIMDKVKQAREEMKECSYGLEDEIVIDLYNVLLILDKLIESEK